MEPIYLRRFSRPLDRPRAARGFTLIELMVVLSIIGILSMVVLTSQNSFNKTLILANTAYDVALTLRSVETQGVGSRVSTIGMVNKNVGYGIDLQIGSPGSFTLFVDKYPSPNSANCHGVPGGDASRPDVQSGNCTYDSGSGPGEFLQTYTLGNGIKIADFCVDGAGGWSCTYAHNNYTGTVTTLDIVFARPDPLPFISVGGSYASSYTGACITLSSPQGTYRYISLTSSGEITANAASCP